MFNKSKNGMGKNMEEIASSHNHISTGTSINGDIETNGDIRIDGSLTGSLKSKGKVVVGPSGKIDGEVYCQNANIAGEITGKVEVVELISLQASAKINGDIITGKLAIEPGAVFTGSCSMGAVIKDIQSRPNVNNKQQAREKTA